MSSDQAGPTAAHPAESQSQPQARGQAQEAATPRAAAGEPPAVPLAEPPSQPHTEPFSGPPARPLPSMPFRPRVDRVNRLVFTLLGLLCLGAGVVALLAGFGVLGAQAADRPVLAAGERAFAADHGWFWPAVGAAAALVTLAALAWLVAQAGRGRLAGLRVADGGTGGVHLDAAALTDAVAGDAAGCPGVHAVGADLRGRPGRPVLRLNVTMEPDADIGALRGCLEDVVVARARSAVGLADLAVEVDIASASRRAARRVR